MYFARLFRWQWMMTFWLRIHLDASLQVLWYVNACVAREVISREQMRKFLKFVHDDVSYCKYYEVVYFLFRTGMCISVKPQIISGDFRRLFKTEIPVTVCGQ